MMKDLVRKCYANGTDVTTMLGGGEHGIIRYPISSTLYAKLSGTPFAVPMAPILTILPTQTHCQLVLYKHEQKENMRVFLNFQHFREALKSYTGYRTGHIY